jgi:hypothetical protein
MIGVYCTVYRTAQIRNSENSLVDLVGFNSNSHKIFMSNDVSLFLGQKVMKSIKVI